MKRISKRKFYKILKKGISVVLIAFIFMGSFLAFSSVDLESILDKKQMASRSEFQGVLNLWLVSTFESGTASKKSHLERSSLLFESQNKGAYVFIHEMTKNECEIKINEGVMPDIICYSGNMGSVFEPYLTELEEVENVKDTLITSGKKNGVELYAYPYMIGGYALITSSSRLQNAGVSIENNSLLSNTYSVGYKKKFAKREKSIYSMISGMKNGNNASLALENELDIKSIQSLKNDLSYEQGLDGLTGYEAYEKWVYGDSVFLLGTQRDLVRAENRQRSGREDGIMVECLSYYSDLVEYVSVVSCNNSIRQKYARKFAKVLMSEQCQNLLARIGMFSTLNLPDYLYSDGLLSQMEKKLDGLSVVPCIF